MPTKTSFWPPQAAVERVIVELQHQEHRIHLQILSAMPLIVWVLISLWYTSVMDWSQNSFSKDEPQWSKLFQAGEIMKIVHTNQSLLFFSHNHYTQMFIFFFLSIDRLHDACFASPFHHPVCISQPIPYEDIGLPCSLIVLGPEWAPKHFKMLVWDSDACLKQQNLVHTVFEPVTSMQCMT